MYSKIRNEVESYGFQVLDYSDKEYDKYSMRDHNHLGYKGWVQIDQDLSHFENVK
ncbi:D-alanyl-lipoteichoic acid biosynthesis protein DltD [Ectobacillus polymachus]|uniref:D-alanyl-lipoteichoic acid biosynthesis protein DltD n=1 Tax=Ectobacillus polymachus TaxID=1508806 RepID=UPI003A87C5A6